MNTRAVPAAFLCLSLAACAAGVQSIRLPVSIVDNLHERRFDVEYHNGTTRTICLANEDWPNPTGDLHEAGDVVAVSVGGERFPIEDVNRGYCSDSSCTIRISPDARISASIPYAKFRLPAHLVSEAKSLSYAPPAYFCDTN